MGADVSLISQGSNVVASAPRQAWSRQSTQIHPSIHPSYEFEAEEGLSTFLHCRSPEEH